MQYVELHARSAFSFLRGASLPEQLAETAGELGLPAIALSDRNGVYGAPRFFGRTKEMGVRPIVGAELTMEDQTVLPVLVESRTGYRNLCQLLTRAHLRNEKGKADVRWNELAEFAEGLVALTGDEEGPLVRAFQKSRSSGRESAPSNASQSRLTSAASILKRLLDIFGPDRLFIEIQRHLVRGEERINNALIDLAETCGLPLLATNGVLYALETQRTVLDVFTCIRHHTHLDAAGKLLSQNSERYLKTARQMSELFRDHPEAVNNTVVLAERLQFTLENLGYEFPSFPVPPEHTMDSFLREQAFAGARQRYGDVPAKVRQQLETELALIQKLKVSGYFLIVWDIVQFCRQNKIMCQGRGSAANSTVCFCLGITAVDPLRFHTLFERFLTEGRKHSWPDIDIDLPSGDRRERVIQEIYRRYGRHGAAMTANVITFRGRSAAREVGKALNLSSDVLNRFSNLYANGDFPHTLDLQAQMEKAGLPKEHSRAPAFAALCQAIHGLPRHLGQHSGGMIIAQDKLDSVVPLENASMPNRVVAQWDKDDCEDLGIIKVDFLGLGMMSVLQDAVELTRRRGNPVDLAQLPQDDPKTFAMMQGADTIGVFQIESRAQMATLPRMKPQCFYDVVIEVAIIRPGPIQGHLMHPYLARRAGREPVDYYHEDLKPVLERTLGVPLFQEQMLQIAMVMADFTGAEAEELRRALSFHRSQDRMQHVATKLRTTMERKGISQKTIDAVSTAISSFALYGFPESHAISFAHLAYASAYLKAHRPLEFYSGLLNNQPMGFYSPATLVKDGQRHGVKFLPVCVMRSEWDCTIERSALAQTSKSADATSGICDAKSLSPSPPRSRGEEAHSNHSNGFSATPLPRPLPALRSGGIGDSEYFQQSNSEVCATSPTAASESIRLGLCVVRGLSNSGAERLLAERRKAPFVSLDDCKRRVGLNQDEWRVLAELGALNCFARHRRDALWNVEKQMHQDDLFSSAALRHSQPNNETLAPEKNQHDSTSPLSPMDYAERIQADFRGMHLTTGAHPMALLRSHLPGIWRASDLPKCQHGSRIRIAGNVICRQRPGTAKGFVFISLEDETGVSNAIVAPPLFEAQRLVITEESFLVIEGRLQHIDGVIHVKAERIERLEHDPLLASGSYDFH